MDRRTIAMLAVGAVVGTFVVTRELPPSTYQPPFRDIRSARPKEPVELMEVEFVAIDFCVGYDVEEDCVALRGPGSRTYRQPTPRPTPEPEPTPEWTFAPGEEHRLYRQAAEGWCHEQHPRRQDRYQACLKEQMR